MSIRLFVHHWTNKCFVLDAGHYAGRLPSTSDLDTTILEQIYGGIKNEYGPEPATNFVRMVAQLESMSASAFIRALYRLESDDWEMSDIPQQSDERNIISARGDAAFGQAMGLLGNLIGDETSNDMIKRRSLEIKLPFIMNHASEISETDHQLAFAF